MGDTYDIDVGRGPGGSGRTHGRHPQGPAETAVSQVTHRRVAILDSDRGFVLVLDKRFERAGWDRQVLGRVPSAAKVAALDVEAVIVDTSLLGAKALDWLRALSAQRPELCVIVCTEHSTVADRVNGLRGGVDDWLGKPCHPEELLARVEAATTHRRRCSPQDASPVRIGEIEIRPDQFQAFVGERSLALTRREYQLLGLLCEAEGEVLSRECIYACLWGYEMGRNDRSVDVFVHKLRRKVEMLSPGWSYIHTHFGVGYRLAPERIEEQVAIAA